jgi:hypothetical protein
MLWRVVSCICVTELGVVGEESGVESRGLRKTIFIMVINSHAKTTGKYMPLSNDGLSFLFAYLSSSCHNLDFYQIGLSSV